jgi:hypothetical protein
MVGAEIKPTSSKESAYADADGMSFFGVANQEFVGFIFYIQQEPDYLGRFSGTHANHREASTWANAEEKNIDIVRTYLNALQSGEAGDALREFFTDDVRQIEMPNQLNKHGQESDLEHTLST